MIDLSGKNALVTGGNTGIGRAIALSLAAHGANVAITSFSTTAEEAVAEIRALGRQAAHARLDVTRSDAVSETVTRLVAELGGRLDILVNNAGHLVDRVPVAEMSDSHWHQVLDVNLSSAFYCTRAALPIMGDGGRVVNMSSLAAHNGGGAGAVAYSAAKAGLLGLTRGLAKELAPRGITVNALAPGLILGTPFHERFNTDDGRRSAVNGIPLKRPGTPDDVANAVLYLASDMASFLTGEVIEINGGAWFR